MVKTQAYTLTYVASPDKTYVIEPKGGEIDYELAHKNPLKFYDNVMNQDIQEHSCAKKGGKRSPLKYSSILTKRAISRVLFVIEKKLNSLIRKEANEIFKTNNEHFDEAEFTIAMQDQEVQAEFQR